MISIIETYIEGGSASSHINIFSFVDLEQKERLFEAQSAQNLSLEETLKQKQEELGMLNVALADKKGELTTLEQSLKKVAEEEEAIKKELEAKKKELEDKKQAEEIAPAAEGSSQPTKEIVEHLESQNRKLHASFDGLKKEIA